MKKFKIEGCVTIEHRHWFSKTIEAFDLEDAKEQASYMDAEMLGLNIDKIGIDDYDVDICIDSTKEE